MSDEYTPTTDEVQDYYVHGQFADPEMSEQEHVEAFNRWLAAHDAEVVREAGARALEDAADAFRSGQITGMFMGRDDYSKAWLRARAAEIRGDHGSD